MSIISKNLEVQIICPHSSGSCDSFQLNLFILEALLHLPFYCSNLSPFIFGAVEFSSFIWGLKNCACSMQMLRSISSPSSPKVSELQFLFFWFMCMWSCALWVASPELMTIPYQSDYALVLWESLDIASVLASLGCSYEPYPLDVSLFLSHVPSRFDCSFSQELTHILWPLFVYSFLELHAKGFMGPK